MCPIKHRNCADAPLCCSELSSRNALPVPQRFIEDYEILKGELMADEILGDPPAHAKTWFARMLDYNVKGGKLNRGMAVYDTLQALKTVSVTARESEAPSCNGMCIGMIW